MLYCLCILKYVLVCRGMAAEQPFENQCQHLLVYVSTNGYFCVHLSVLKAYILTVDKSAESVFWPPKIGGKSA